jgi:hypothetical protein
MDIEKLSDQIADMRRDMDIRFAVIDAKLDSKPGYGAMYTAVLGLAIGIGGVITSTIVVLKALGKL